MELKEIHITLEAVRVAQEVFVICLFQDVIFLINGLDLFLDKDYRSVKCYLHHISFRAGNINMLLNIIWVLHQEFNFANTVNVNHLAELLFLKFFHC